MNAMVLNKGVYSEAVFDKVFLKGGRVILSWKKGFALE